ncbi:MAG: tRNA dihydrouridine synthase DusB [Planctomycetota bacterium]
MNQGVAPAEPGEFAPLEIGPLTTDPPVVLAPMAGVTNSPFRRLCREFGPGLFVSEMITCRGLTEGNRKTHHLTSFAADERPRSLQLYGTDAKHLGEAARMLVAEDRVDHLDMNLGCPVRKVTSQGGGAALPLRPLLLAELLGALVKAAGEVPVTVKFRKGIDQDHLYFLETGRIAMEAGVVAVGLHARTASQLYDGDADWNAISELKASLPIPVLGNGDIFEPYDALRMMRQTGCDGVIVGRGVLGRPWLFRDLAHLFRGEEPPDPPTLGEIADIALRHGRELVKFFGEYLGVRHMRRHGAWYTKGFPGTAELRKELNRATTFDEVEALFRALDPDQPFPAGSIRARRGKRAGTQKVSLPWGLLEGEG